MIATMLHYAHGVGGRADLPVPFWMALYGAGIAVVLSFAALGVLWPTARLRADKGRAFPAWLASLVDSPIVRWALRLLVLAATLVLVAAAFFGKPAVFRNPLPWFLFIQLWVGLVPASLLLGPVWRAVSPLRTIHRLVSYAAGKDPRAGVRELPARLGYWPAVASLLAFAWVELVLPERGAPRMLGTLVVTYGAVHLVCAAAYGEDWFARADAFEVYSTLIGSLAPFGRTPDGVLVVRNPLDGLTSVECAPGLVPFVAVLLGSTTYDGVTRQRWWRSWTKRSPGWPGVPRDTAMLVLCVVVVFVTYRVGTRLAAREAGADPRPLPAAFVHTIVPIAVGYAIAHYFSLLFVDGQRSWILASDPFGTGANWFGTAHWTVNAALLSRRTVSLTQIGAIVVGHVLGVVSAHDTAVARFKGRAAVRGQYPLLAVMVVYTVGGVALLLGT